MKLEVVTIGTELVLGLTPDTNAADLGRALAAAGAEIVRHVAIPDRPAIIRTTIAESLERTGFVIATGGLGPTRDDMTKHEVAALFGKPLRLDAGVLASLEARFRRLGRPMPAVNRTQAEVPEGAIVLPNPRGTAPGLWLEDDRGRVAVLLPGVPSEMRGLLVEEVLPRVAQRVGGGRVVLSRTLRTTGVPESALAERVGSIEEDIAPLTLAYIPSIEGVDLRLTAWSLPPDEAEQRLTTHATALRARLEEHYYGEDGADLAAVVLDRLRGERLAVGESCTGGLVAARITAVAGASQVFVGGIVAYANGVKGDLLDVPAATIEAHGAVSEEAVRSMVEGVQRRFETGAAIAVTGIAGPGGGTPEKPVGTVWLAARLRGETRVVKRVFPGDRGEIRARAAQAALDLLRRMLGP